MSFIINKLRKIKNGASALPADAPISKEDKRSLLFFRLGFRKCAENLLTFFPTAFRHQLVDAFKTFQNVSFLADLARAFQTRMLGHRCFSIMFVMFVLFQNFFNSAKQQYTPTFKKVKPSFFFLRFFHDFPEVSTGMPAIQRDRRIILQRDGHSPPVDKIAPYFRFSSLQKVDSGCILYAF